MDNNTNNEDTNNNETPQDETQPQDESTPRGYDEMMADPNLTEEDVATELQKYAECLRQEFAKSLEADPENVEEYTQQFFKNNIHSAAGQIVWLMLNAESETVRANMSKYVVERALKNEEAGQDPVTDILKKLSGNKKLPVAPMGNEDAGKEN